MPYLINFQAFNFYFSGAFVILRRIFYIFLANSSIRNVDFVPSFAKLNPFLLKDYIFSEV